jgi:hypothetical protein
MNKHVLVWRIPVIKVELRKPDDKIGKACHSCGAGMDYEEIKPIEIPMFKITIHSGGGRGDILVYLCEDCAADLRSQLIGNISSLRVKKAYNKK